MIDHRTLATWDHESTSYTVTLRIEGGKPTGLIIEAIKGAQSRRATLPIDFGSGEWYAEAWNHIG